MKIGITSMFVDDPVRAFRFYTEVLGFTKKIFIPTQWIAIVVSPEDPDGTSLMLEPNHNAIAKRYQKGLYKAGIPAMVFTTTDIEAEHKRLQNLGVHFRKEPVKTKDGLKRCLRTALEISFSYIRVHEQITRNVVRNFRCPD